MPPGVGPRDNEPELPEINPHDVPRNVRAELKSLPKELAATVGAHLVEVATANGPADRTELAGPQVVGLVDLARRTVRARGRHRWVRAHRWPQ